MGKLMLNSRSFTGNKNALMLNGKNYSSLVPSGSSFESVLKDGVVSTNSSYATASFSDISNYKNIVIRLKGTIDGTYYENINSVEVSTIGNGISLRFCLGKVIYVNLTKTSIGVSAYSGNYYYIYADIAGTEDDINIWE